MTDTNGWEIIDVYSRKEAIQDGVQVEADPVTRMEAGIKFPVFFTQKVYDKYVKVPDGFEGIQDEDGRLWDIFTMFKHAARNCEGSFIEMKVSVTMPNNGDWERNEKRCGSDTQRLVTLHAVIGPMDFDDPAPAITISTPEED